VADFREIAHCGGYVSITSLIIDGVPKASLTVGGSSPNAMAWLGYGVSPRGVVLGRVPLHGIGVPIVVPAGALPWPVMLGSDSEGKFGHQCPKCAGYWRSESAQDVMYCPYCGERFPAHQLLTPAHKAYCELFADMCLEALQSAIAEQPIERRMEFDRIADEAERQTKRPAFYYAEQSQQYRFLCSACGAFNDVLGRSCYCCGCGSRNDREVASERIKDIRARLHSGGSPNDGLRDAVSLFDGTIGHIITQLLCRVPLRSRLRAAIQSRPKHQIEAVAYAMSQAFAIDIFEGVSASRRTLAVRLFLRRHVHEHQGSIVDQDYLQRSNDTSVKVGQHLVESREEVQTLTEIQMLMIDNLSNGFAELFPPSEDAIGKYQAEVTRLKGHGISPRTTGPQP
jgi:hypothetical protein